MAQLLVSVAINAAIGLALNALFPPPDIEQEGPRLRDLNFTGSAYGRFVNILFGTDRIGGNIIDTQNPAIEEVVSEETESVGKGGGQDVTTTTYSYYFTGRIAFAIAGNAKLIRLWGDGKLIYDATSNDQQLRAGVTLRFDAGGETQTADAEELSRDGRDATNQPAYRHLTTIKLDRLPLEDFGNRIPNFTAEIAMDGSSTNSATPLAGLPGSVNVPNSANEQLIIDPFRDLVIACNRSGDSFVFRNSSMEYIGTVATNARGASRTTTCLDGYVYGLTDGNNSKILRKWDAQTGQQVASLGGASNGTTEVSSAINDDVRFINVDRLDGLKTTVPGQGVFHTLYHAVEGFDAPPRIHVVNADSMRSITLLTVNNSPLVDTGANWSGEMAPDHDRGTMIVLQSTGSGVKVILLTPVTGFGGQTGAGAVGKSTLVFSSGGQDVSGWAINRTNGDIILNNGSELILYNPYDDVVLARRTQSGVGTGFASNNNYYSGSQFGWINGELTGSGFIRVIDTRTLEDVYFAGDVTAAVPDLAAVSTTDVFTDSCQVWDDARQAIIIPRGSVSGINRLVKVFILRSSSEGVALSSVVQSLSTSYQGIEMAGLDASDVDVTALAGDSVLGYTINNRSTIRDALQPLRDRFFFDAVQSDWKIKFPKRGGSAVVTIPQEFVGELRSNPGPKNPNIGETRVQDIELPMRFNVRYRNQDADYDPDTQGDKRQRQPTSTMSSRLEKTLDIPIVDTPENMKRVAQNWLWTLWNERRALSSTIPWRYLQVTPTDVVNIGAFGETSRIRMAEIDIGVSLFMGFTGVQEEAYTFESTILAGSTNGRPTINVPSSLPSDLYFLDAPLLSQSDFTLGQVSNGYFAARGFSSGWPGASVVRSADGFNFALIGAVSTQAAVGILSTPPPAMEVSLEGDYANRFVDSSLTFRPFNRSDSWESAADDTAVLNGANVFAIVYADGSCAIHQYRDATDNGNGTITLSRLLLGRLGTEDIAATAPAAGASIVLLSSSTGVLEASAIQKQALSLTQLNTALTYKAVTTGTLLEDAEAEVATYTGRDLRPFSVAQVTAVLDGGGDVDVAWVRRARGPFSAEWLDGTGTIPLNEALEQYEVVLSGTGGSITKTIDDATTATFTSAEITAEFTTLPGDAVVTVAQVSETGLKSPTFEIEVAQ
jgi:hypothetical protein